MFLMKLRFEFLIHIDFFKHCHGENMSYMISDDCNSCGACEPECPNEAISEGDSQYMINASKCTECVGFFETPQCASVCPVDSCMIDPQHVENESALIEKVKILYPSKSFPEQMPSRFSS